jgi:hypothetical protein
MKKILISTASAAALLASITLVAAQGPDGGGPSGGATGGPGMDPGAGSTAGSSGGGAGESKASPPDQGASPGNRSEREPSTGARESKGAAGKSDDGSSASKEEPRGIKDKDRDAGTKRATKEQEPEKSGSTVGADSKGSGKSAAEGKSTGESGEAGPVQLSGEKRTQVQSAFAGHKSSAKVDLKISVAVGVGVPRHVHLVAIPEDIVVIVPQWRRYRYIIVDDVVCIVDPDTFVIVEVIQLA